MITKQADTVTAGDSPAGVMTAFDSERERVFDAFRRWGYLEADLDPLGFLRSQLHPDLIIDGEFAEEARQIYCGTVGAEFVHIADPERRRWIQERLEGPQAPVDQDAVLDQLIRADLFEQVLQHRYLGNKRFSLEGVTALIPLVDEILEGAGELGAVELVMGMSHRGRLNVIVQVAKRAPEEVFAGFEDVDPRSVLGSGDVKYHMGATGEYVTRSGAKIHIHLVSNPSHLEAVDPVTVGRTRAKQDRAGAGGTRKYLPLLVHGDGAFAGQGIFAETLNYSDIPGFSVGGTGRERRGAGFEGRRPASAGRFQRSNVPARTTTCRCNANQAPYSDQLIEQVLAFREFGRSTQAIETVAATFDGGRLRVPTFASGHDRRAIGHYPSPT